MSEPPRRSLRAEHMQATRDALVASGRLLFGRDGFANTSVEEIARQAGVTTGALYHHFATKTVLFETVFEGLEFELQARSAAAARGGRTPLEQLRLAFDAFLDAALERDVQRISLIDAPAVLGLERSAEIYDRYSYRGVTSLLERAASDGAVTVHDPAALAHLLLGALMSGGSVIARADDPEVARAAIGRSVRDLLDGLARR
jgi:AcrR family transcriptional regulator